MLRIERLDLPPTPDTSRGEVDEWADYAVVICGPIRATIQRWCYWHPTDGHPLDVRFEANINGLPDTAGTADVCTEDAAVLLMVAEVSVQAALLLDEARKRYAMRESTSTRNRHPVRIGSSPHGRGSRKQTG